MRQHTASEYVNIASVYIVNKRLDEFMKKSKKLNPNSNSNRCEFYKIGTLYFICHLIFGLWNFLFFPLDPLKFVEYRE